MRVSVPLQPMMMSARAIAAGSFRAVSAVPPLLATNASARPDWEKTERVGHRLLLSISATQTA